MDWLTIIGLGGSFFTVTMGIIITGAGFGSYISLTSILITLGGSLGAMITMQHFVTLRRFFQILTLAFRYETIDYSQTVATLVSFSEKARREGLLALEDDLEQLGDNTFLQTGLQLVIDGADPEMVKQILVSDINALEARHEANRKMFNDLGLLSPTFGLIGTLIGLILMLVSLGSGSVELIGRGMSAALLTTLYGAYLAYGVWIPIASKLEKKTMDEIFIREIILEGTLSLQFGDNPKMMQQKLSAYFPEAFKKQLQQEIVTT